MLNARAVAVGSSISKLFSINLSISGFVTIEELP